MAQENDDISEDWEQILNSWGFSEADYSDTTDVNEEDAEKSLIMSLERNSPNFYWLNLSKPVRNATKLTRAIRSNRLVGNVTLYNRALDGMTTDEQESFVNAICCLSSMKSLNVILASADCFLNPLIHFPPPALTQLTLFKLDLSEPATRRLAVKALSGLSQLKDLCLQQFQCNNNNNNDDDDDNYNDDGALLALSQVVCHYHELQDLTLHAGYGVALGDKGLVALADALCCGCPQLQTLSLETFAVGHTSDGGGRALTQLAKQSRTLNEFEFTCGSIMEVKYNNDSFVGFSPQLRIEMEHYIKLNRSGIRNVLLSVNVTEEDFLNTMMKERDNLDHLFTLLSQHPVFPPMVSYAC